MLAAGDGAVAVLCFALERRRNLRLLAGPARLESPRPPLEDPFGALAPPRPEQTPELGGGRLARAPRLGFRGHGLRRLRGPGHRVEIEEWIARVREQRDADLLLARVAQV